VFEKTPARRRLLSASSTKKQSMLLPVPEEAKQQHVDKTAFATTKHVAALRVPKQRCQELMRKFRGWVRQWPAKARVKMLKVDWTADNCKHCFLHF